MRTKMIRFAFLLTMLLLPLSASAFYNPQAGRWLSRDPLNEQGGANIFCAVRNDAVNRVDSFGLFCSQSRCAGKPYSPSTSCCKYGVIVSRSEIGTAVFKYNYAPARPLPDFMGHQWLEFPGGSAGYNHWNNHQWHSPDPEEGNRGQGITGVEIKLSPCKYNIPGFVASIQAKTSVDIGQVPGTYDCGSYANEMINESEADNEYIPEFL